MKIITIIIGIIAVAVMIFLMYQVALLGINSVDPTKDRGTFKQKCEARGGIHSDAFFNGGGCYGLTN